MDNLCHTLVGVALSRAGCDRLTSYALPTLVVASNLPDVDIVAWYWGDLAYLVHHRGITHSYVGILGQALALAAAMTGLGRFLARRREAGERPTFAGLFVVSVVGLLTHLLLDFTNAYGVRPNLPFEDRWVYGDLVFIVDPWLWLVFGGALYAGARRARSVDFWNIALFAVLTALVVGAAASPESGRVAAIWFWAAGMIASLVARRLCGPRHARLLARLALCALVVYWGALAVANEVARTVVRERYRVAAGSEVAALPTPLFPSHWRVMVANDEIVREYHVTAIGTPSVVEAATYERALHTEPARAALGTCAGRVAAWFNRYLVADVVTNADGWTRVNLRDVRFPAPAAPGIANTVVELDSSLLPVDDWRTCPE